MVRLATAFATVVALSAQIAFVNAAITRRTTCPGGQTVLHAQCCDLFPVIDLLQSEQLFDGECGEDAHSALRLAFHDAIGFSLLGGKGGGADGSILVFPSEVGDVGNEGIDDIVAAQTPVWQQTSLTAGDFVHLAAAIGTANCAGAPKLKVFIGRPAPAAAAPAGVIPLPTDNVPTILARFAEAGFTPAEVVALLASHTIAAADEVDPTVPGTPFDSTVETFDSQIFLEVLLQGSFFPGAGPTSGQVAAPIEGEMRLQSDFAISQDPATACFWQEMINDQTSMVTQFKAAMAKLQVLGQNILSLTDCSDVVQTPATFDADIKYPPTFNQSTVQQACILPFPSLATTPGPAESLSPVED